MTEEQLAEIEAALAVARPGPWRRQVAACQHEDQDEHSAIKGGGYLVVDCVEDVADADLIAQAPAWLAALVAEVRRHKATTDRVRATLADLAKIEGDIHDTVIMDAIDAALAGP
jgi:hypothetical protein